MAVKLAAATANGLADKVDDLINAGGAGKIQIYTGSQPTTADDSATGTKLAEFTLSATAFGNASSGVITLAGVPLTVAAVATGTAGYFRVLSGGTAKVLDGSVGTSGAELILNTTAISSGVNVTITAGTITMPTT